MEQADGRALLLENMPRWTAPGTGGVYKSLFVTPICPVYRSLRALGFGCCLDTANMVAAWNAYPNAFDHPPTTAVDRPIQFDMTPEDEWEDLELFRAELDWRRNFYDRALLDLLAEEPAVVHTRAMDYFDLRKHDHGMTSLNGRQLATIIPYCEAHDVPLILEMPLECLPPAIEYMRTASSEI